MANFKQGEPARKDYHSVKYFPFGNEPASTYVLTSNPFTYLSAWLDKEIGGIKKDTDRKRKLNKAKYFCDLAESFNGSALNSRMPIKGTLLYYAHLNLVKCYLLVNNLDLERAFEHHGISFPHNYSNSIKIGTKPEEGISIFREFVIKSGNNFDNVAGQDVSIDELLFELPEIHELGHSLKIFAEKRKLLPVTIEILTNKDTRTKLFYEISFEKKNENIMSTTKLDAGSLKAKLKRVESEDASIIKYRSVSKFNYDTKDHDSWCRAYNKICSSITSLGVTSLLTHGGYRYYINLKPAKLNRLNAVLAFMFYVGSVARYRPSLNQSILKGDHQALFNEAIDTCPNQFYYHLVSHITKNVCAVPMAKI